MPSEHGHIGKLLKSRASIVELVVVAIVLALAINLIAGSILSFLGAQKIAYALYAGLVLVGLTLVYFGYRILSSRTASSKLEGAYVIKRESGEFIEVPLYEYSRDVGGYLQSAFAENAALKKAWDQYPISKAIEFDADSKQVLYTEPKALKLLQEASEYFLLDEFSLHLSSYFSERELDESRLVTLSRHDIPSILLSNRFLELFSTPMEDREAFAEQPDTPGRGEVVASWSKSGMFSRFELVLPKKSVVTRNPKGGITIETPRLVLNLNAEVSAMNTSFPRGVLEHVLGESEPREFSVHKATITLNARFKFGSLLSGAGWDYYRWFDSFGTEIREKFSIDDFFERRGWSFAETMLFMLRRQPNDES
jgi:hypothetical protein